MNNQQRITKELGIINSLLHDEKYAEEMARELDAAYYKGIGQVPPPFLSPGEDTLIIEKSAKEEKIATSIAGFYALECGTSYLCDHSELTPLQWIEKIISKQIDDAAILILNRFANATWKAGQPFKGLKRIKKVNFISASSLSPEEVQKNYNQVMAAAKKLSQSLKEGSKDEEMEQLRGRLQDKDYTYQMAALIDSSFYAGDKKTAKVFISSEEETAVKEKTFKEEKIATNLAGFYALECATNYLVTTRHIAPSDILQSLVNNATSKEDRLLYARFANATWKAGQPFRSLDRITREPFIPFYFLKEQDIEKDIVQVKAAAQKLLESLE